MNVPFNIWVVFFSCGFVMGIFMTLLFAISSKRHSYQAHNITITFFILSLLLFSEIAEESNLVDNYPMLLGLSRTLDLLLWPFLTFYIQFITGIRMQYKWVDTLYFSPYLIAFAWQSPFLLLPAESKLSYFSNGIPQDIALLVGFKMIVSVLFLLYILSLLTTALAKFKNAFPRNKKVQFLTRNRQFFIGISAIVLFIYLNFFNHYFELLPLGDSDRMSSLIISSLFYFFGVLIFRNPQMFQEENYSKQVKDSFNGTETKHTEKLLKLFEDTKIFLNEKLAVKDVAKEMGLTSQQLSYLINRELGITFLDFINSYRVKQVQENIKNGEHQLKTLLGLALESGFNSKASFNRIFKDHTGLSPSNYVKKEVSNPN